MTAAARCIQCDSSFTEEQLQGATSCPTCGTKSVPLDPARDVTVRLNWHELRVLGIFAGRWAGERCGPSEQKSVQCIVQRLQRQHPALPKLSLAGEVRDMQAAGVDCSLSDGAGNEIVPRKGPLS